MKKILIVWCTLLYGVMLCAQQKNIDTTACANWPVISDVAISPKGNFTAYQLGARNEKCLIVQAIKGTWKMKIDAVRKFNFCGEDQYLLLDMPGDSLQLLTLGTGSIKPIGTVVDYQQPNGRNSNLIAYHLKATPTELCVQDLTKNGLLVKKLAQAYAFSETDDQLVAVAASPKGGNASMIFWYDLLKGTCDSAFMDFIPYNLIFNRQGTYLAFFCNRISNGVSQRQLWCLKRGATVPTLLADSATSALKDLAVSRGPLFFSDNGQRVYFNLEDVVTSPAPIVGAAKVDIWNYQEEELQATQMRNRRTRTYVAMANLGTGEVLRLQKSQDYNISDLMGKGDAYALAIGDVANKSNQMYMEGTPFSLINLQDGTRRDLGGHFKGTAKLSPTGKYVLAFDKKEAHWYCYTVSNGAISNITGSITTPLTYENDTPNPPNGQGIAGWLSNDKAVLIYDRFDIWEVDPTGKRSPRNLTKGLGQRSNIRFRHLQLDRRKEAIFQDGDTLLLTAFDIRTKENGFYKLVLGSSGLPMRLAMEPATYFFYYRSMGPSICGINDPYLPIKAAKSNGYVLRRMTASQYPNLVFTDNFMDFSPITNLTPEKEYKWFNAELLNWKQPDGTPMEAILYKPEHIDSTKKYPVIFYYYEQMGDALNLYIQPALSNGAMNIPWFVSNGYFVCVPSLQFRIGQPGQSALNGVVSAAQHLRSRRYIDSSRMGLNGHSFGGFITNYIVSHTDKFAAAAAGAGAVDLISAYGNINDLGFSKHFYYELSQGRIGATLWKQRKGYIENSPIFEADKVNTPLLIMHNKEDGAVPFAQGVEWFTALQSLGKKAWMLQYDGENHVLHNPTAKLDYSLRLQQFFDHYLKGKPMPVWMSRGVAAKLKGLKTGLEYE